MKKKLNKISVRGKVASSKMDKTIVVLVERMIKHPVYGKYIKKSARFVAHDELNTCKEGDFVEIVSTKPISKHKVWALSRIETNS